MKQIYLTLIAFLLLLSTNNLKAQTVIAYNDQIILPGQSLTLYADADTNSSQTVIFQWSPTVGMLNSNSISPTVTPTQTTTYHVNVTVNGSFWATDSVTITVMNPQTNAGIDKTIQYGGSVAFYDASFDAFMPKKAVFDQPFFSKMKFFTANLGFVTNMGSYNVYKTTDGGNIYKKVLQTTTTINTMYFADSLRGAVGTSDGDFYYTANGGLTWNVSYPSNYPIRGIHYTPNYIYVIADAGEMKKSANGGMTWTTVSSGTTLDLLSVQFLNDSVGFLGVYSTTGAFVKKTVNSGTTWTMQGGSFGYIEDMHFINENIGYIVDFLVAKRTINGGQTWTDIVVDGGAITGFNQSLRSIEFLNDSIGYIGSPFIKTTDGGANWTKIETLFPPAFDISAVDEHTIFGAGANFVRYLDPQYSWIPNSNLNNPNEKNPIFTPGVTTNYIMNVDAIYGYSVSDTVLISVPDPCMAQISYIVNTSNNSVAFSTALSQPPYTVSPFTFLWQFGDGTQSTYGNTNHGFSSQGYQTIQFSAHSWNGCTVDTTFIVAIGNASSVDCQADFGYSINHNTRTVSLSNFSMGDNLSSYDWYFDDGSFDNNPITSHTYSAAGNYNVCLTVGSQTSGCRSTKCKMMIVDTLATNCNAQFTYTVDSASKTVSYYNNSNGNITNNWQFGDNSTSTDLNPVHVFQNNRYYFTELIINGNGCSDYISKIVNVNMATPSLFSSFGYAIDGNYYKSNTYPVKFYSASAGTPAIYHWDFGDGTSDSLTNQPLHEYQNGGNYTVCLTVSDPLAQLTFDTCMTIFVDGINKIGEEANFQIYPNPAENQITIDIQSFNNENFSLVIMDIRGKIILAKNEVKTNEVINISSISNGVYFVKVYNKHENNIRKLMINR